MLPFLSLCLSALISGAFPILVSPYTADARLDTEVLVSEALFIESEGASGIVWPSAAEISEMEELGEYELGLEALAARWDAAILGRLPNDIESEAEMEDYFRSLIYGSDRIFDNDTSAADLNCSLEKVSEMLIPSSSLGCEKPVYSRIKKMADGGYILIYQGGRIGSNIYYNISYDLKNWGKSRKLFSAHPIVSELGEDERRYSSADATVLSNGDILVYVSARAHRAYRTSPASNYIALRRSSDNGKSWSDEQFIYNGTTWEPYILQLPSGKLQCYFTDSAPMIHSSGTSLIESFDNGYTWTPSGIGNCHKVIRQHRYASKDSAHIFTDQMPCVKVLKDGHTLLGFMESKIGDTYYLSLVRTVDDWEHLAQGELGPSDRESNVIRGAAGYVSVFPSGEVVLSGNFNGLFKLKLGSADGRHFQGRDWSEGWITTFSGRGYWGSTEIIGDDLLLATMHCAQGIQLATFRLKHHMDGRGHAKKTTSSRRETARLLVHN